MSPVTPMRFNLEGKTFRVVRNDGSGADVTLETRFHFHQQGNIVHADYSGGRVKLGKLLGLLQGNTMRHHYLQINHRDEFHGGHGDDEIRLTPEGKIQLIDKWNWETKEGSGICILEEL
jgi:hypothetical protein